MATEAGALKSGFHSLEEIHSSVPIPPTLWRRLLAFTGPAFLVSVGYMDPGNWGTDIEAGSRFGYRLLWVLLMSNLMAVLLQSLATRLGVVTGRDLAQACRESYPRGAVVVLWLLTEIAIAATDLAEVIGTIIALKLLFGVPYLWGLLIAVSDTFLLLALQRRGVRLLELVTLGLIGVIAGSFVIEIVLCKPAWAEVVRGFVPGLAPGQTVDSLYVAIAMLGATVMPHNLYLHSALVQTRAFPQTAAGKRLACKYNLLDSLLALNGAFLVNAAILVVSVSSFQSPVKTLQEAHTLLKDVWGTAASGLFAVALLASGQSSTLTGTLAGQVVMEGFVRLRLRPWARRLLTRSLAIVPALLVIGLTTHGAEAPTLAAGAAQAGAAKEVVDARLLELLVLSQAILSLQLPFAIVPLVQFTSDRRRMGLFVSRPWLKVLAWTCAAVVVALNLVLIGLQLNEWAGASEDPWWIYGTAGSVALTLVLFLGWLTLYPLWSHREESRPAPVSLVLAGVRYQRIGVAVEFEGGDAAVLAQAVNLARGHGAEIVTVHVVEGPAAALLGAAADDQESRNDRSRMADLVHHLRRHGVEARGVLGYGIPPDELVRIAQEQRLDLLVLGTHGHRFLADLTLGQTVSPVLHKLSIPILVVPTRLGAAPPAQQANPAPAPL
jgi:manganese transport protein